MSSFTGGVRALRPVEDHRRPRGRSPAGRRWRCWSRACFDPARFLDLVRNFVVFSDERDRPREAGREVPPVLGGQRGRRVHRRRGRPDGDRRGGVVWHTQGRARASRCCSTPPRSCATRAWATRRWCSSPTATTWTTSCSARCSRPAAILPEKPVQADSRAELRTLLRRASGGIVFTTLQKFAPEQAGGDAQPGADRPAQRGGGGRRGAPVAVRFTRPHRRPFKAAWPSTCATPCPNATFLGFTGTPIESDRQVHPGGVRRLHRRLRPDPRRRGRRHGEDLLRVPAGQGRAARGRPRARSTSWPTRSPSGVEEPRPTKAKSQWARLEAIVGAEERLDLIAADIVAALGEAPRGDARQGDDRGDVAAHRGATLRQDRRAAPGLAHRRPRRRARSRS